MSKANIYGSMENLSIVFAAEIADDLKEKKKAFTQFTVNVDGGKSVDVRVTIIDTPEDKELNK